MEFNSMILDASDSIQRYCKDVLKLWSLTANNFRKEDCKSNLAQTSVVEKMLLKVEAMARFFAQNVIWWKPEDQCASADITDITHIQKSCDRSSPDSISSNEV